MLSGLNSNQYKQIELCLSMPATNRKWNNVVFPTMWKHQIPGNVSDENV